MTIHSIPSLLSNEGKIIVEAPNYPNWITFSRNLSNDNNYPHVILYINIYLTSLQFSLWKDILNYRDICCFYFFNSSKIFFLLNIYLDFNESTLKYLKNTKANIHNVLIMTGDFNIRDSNWDLDHPFHSVHSNLLFDIVATFNLSFSYSTHSISTRYLDNSRNLNSVINLMFFRLNSSELDNYSILSEL